MDFDFDGKTEQEIIDELHLDYWRNRWSDNAVSLNSYSGHVQCTLGVDESIVKEFVKIAFGVPKNAPLSEVRLMAKRLQIRFAEQIVSFVGQGTEWTRLESEIDFWVDEIRNHIAFIMHHKTKQ